MRRILILGAILYTSACGYSEESFQNMLLNNCSAAGECAANMEGIDAEETTKLCEEIVGTITYDAGCTFDKKAARECLYEVTNLTCNTETGLLEGPTPSCENVYIDANEKACEATFSE